MYNLKRSGISTAKSWALDPIDVAAPDDNPFPVDPAKEDKDDDTDDAKDAGLETAMDIDIDVAAKCGTCTYTGVDCRTCHLARAYTSTSVRMKATAYQM
ncbi:hypothetical protein HK102_004279 [Quaeritorhiza haematococci]|nr:hypothetical protein HK102_004279 [Quaeritorhiza haematococci]